MRKIRYIYVALMISISLLSACGKHTDSTAVQGQIETQELLSWQEKYELGMRYLSEGNYEEAIIAFTAAIEIEPKEVKLYLGRGEAYIALGETAENLMAAKSDYETAISIDETLPEAWLGLADVYIRQGEYEKAQEILEEALEKTGNDQSIADKLKELEEGIFKDAKGNVRRKNMYDGNGQLVWYHIYTYDAQGREQMATSYDASGTQTGQVELTYDEQGFRTTGYVSIDDTGEVVKRVYEYDDTGNKIKAVDYHSGGTGIRVSSFQYDEMGNKIREDHYDQENNSLGYFIYSYDISGNLIQQDTYNSSGRLQSYIVYSYDENNNLMKTLSYDKDGKMKWNKNYIYDEQGKCIGSEKYDQTGNLIQSEVNETGNSN